MKTEKEEKEAEKNIDEIVEKAVQKTLEAMEQKTQQEEMEKKARKARKKFINEIKERLNIDGDPEVLQNMTVEDLRVVNKAMKELNIQFPKRNPFAIFGEKYTKYALPVLLIGLTALFGLIFAAVV